MLSTSVESVRKPELRGGGGFHGGGGGGNARVVTVHKVLVLVPSHASAEAACAALDGKQLRNDAGADLPIFRVSQLRSASGPPRPST